MPGRKAGEKHGYQYDACDGQDEGIPAVGGDENVKGFCYIIIGVIKKGPASLRALFPTRTVCQSRLFVLMTILAQAFFTLVRSHLMSFTFLSAWHVI